MDPKASSSTKSPIDAMSAAPPAAELGGDGFQTGPDGVRSKSLSSVWQQTLNSRTAVLGTLFLVTGALGLPLVWYSPVFTRFEKLFWTLMALIYTSALIGVTWAIVYWCYKLITDSF